MIIYEVTKLFPKEELYTLTSQVRRAAISIPSNVAEGATRKSTKEYLQFLRIAFGSISELETQLLIAKELKYIENKRFEEVEDLLLEVSKMLNGLLISLKRKMVTSH